MTTPSPPAWQPSRHVAISIGLVALVGATAFAWSSYVPNTYILRDGRFYTNVTATLTESLSIEQPYARSWYGGTLGWNHNLDAGWSNIALGRQGEHLPKHPLLLPLLSAPFFYAFDVRGHLLFNVLLFFIVGGCAFGIARRYVDDDDEPAAAIAALALPLGTSILLYAYDYHVDTLLLALFLGGVLALHRGRGALAGFLVALTVTLKPTCLMWLPTLLLFAFSPQVELDRRGLLRALGAGTAVLLVYAAINTWLFGRPYWAGYNRTLVVVNGEPGIADHVDAFSFPLEAGLRRLFFGNYGLARLFALFTVALPGWILLARRAPRYVAGSVLALVLAVLVFSKYDWEGDRFMWPALGLLVPSLAASLAFLARGVRLAARRLRPKALARTDLPGLAPGPSPAPVPGLPAHALLVGGAVLCVLLTQLAAGQRPSRGMEATPYAFSARQLATEHTFSVMNTELMQGDRVGAQQEGATSRVAQTRFGTPVARVSPIATALAAPFAWFEAPGLIALHVLLAVLLSVLLVALHPRPPTVVAASVLLLFWLPGVTQRVLDGGPPLIGAVTVIAALVAAERGRAALAMWSAVLAMSISETALFVIPAVLVLVAAQLRRAHRDGELPSDWRKSLALALLPPLVAGLSFHLLYWGRPLGVSSEFVLSAGLDAPVHVPPSGSLTALLDAIFGGHAAPLRGAAPLLLLALPGIGLIAVGRRDLAIALGVLLLSLAMPSVASAEAGLPLFAYALLTLPTARALAVLGSLVDTYSHVLQDRAPRAMYWALPVLVGALLLVGGLRRALADTRFDVSNPQAIRHARVSLSVRRRPNGPERVPCDFFAWEYQSWECATFDRGVTLTGLATAAAATERPHAPAALYLSTSAQGLERVIEYDEVLLGERFALEGRLAEGSHASGTLSVFFGDERVGQLDLSTLASSAEPSTLGQDASLPGGGVEDLRRLLEFDTSARRGESVTLSLRLQSYPHRSALWLRGGPQ